MSTPKITPVGNAMTVEGDDDRETRSISYTFWRGEQTRFRAEAGEMAKPGALADHVLAGMMPAEPFIDRNTTIVAFGSCFAGHISGYLNNLGFDVATKRGGRAYISRMGDGIVNSYAVRQQFEWAWEGKVPSVALWHGYKAEEFGYDEEVRCATRDLFDASDVFIITLGLSEIWYDEPTGEVFWRAVPHERFDPTRHKFRVASAAENRTNLEAIYALIRKHRPDAAIILTLSPIPLAATFRSISPFAADTVSKASLRVAIDELMRLRQPDDNRLFYYPSYEVVQWCFRHPFVEDLRHPHLHVLEVNMKAFERYFCQTGLSDADLELVYLDAMIKDRELGTLPLDADNDWQKMRKAWNALNPAESLKRQQEREKMNAAIDARMSERAERVAAREARMAARAERQAQQAHARAERHARQATRKPGAT